MYRLRLDGREVYSGPDYRDAIREFHKWRDTLKTGEILALHSDGSRAAIARAWGPEAYNPIRVLTHPH